MVLRPPPTTIDFLRDPAVGRLRVLARSRQAPFQLVARGRMVLTWLNGASLRETAQRHGTSVSVVRRWVGRWRRQRRVEALQDRPRSGRPKTFDLRVEAKVLSIVSQSPAAFGIPDASWTQPLVVQVLASEGVVASRSTVQRILSRQDIDIRTVRYWLWTPKDRPGYEQRRDAICDVYLGMNELPEDEVVVCFDAKPGIQILGDPKNKGGSSGPRSGQPRRLEFEYRRRGTRGLVAAVRPDTGEVVHYDLYDKDRRFDSAATIEFLERLRLQLQAQGYRKVHLVLDNGSTHVSKATTAYFRANSASFTTYFTPVHASWLNLCENFFSTFSRRYLRHRRYGSVDEFVRGIPVWIRDHNQRANPLRWTYAPHQQAAA